MIDLDQVFGESGSAPVAVAPEPKAMPITAPEPINATDRGEPIDAEPEPAAVDEYEWGEAIDPPETCPVCNGLAVWQDLAGGWHCQ